MSSDVPPSVHLDLLRILSESKQALSASGIHDQLTLKPPKRTLQARLKTLVEDGIVTRQGQRFDMSECYETALPAQVDFF